MDYEELKRSVAEDAAIRRRQRLQPVGGQGDKIFPPTYPGETKNSPARHIFEQRRVDGDDVWCALLDSVQSQANRLEEALLAAAREGAATIPYVTVDFRQEQLAGVDEITSLDAPHRVYDAILRDSLLDGKPFTESELGLGLAKANPAHAAALLEVSPTALLFGAWNSTGEGGGLGAKFPRTLVSEVVAVRVKQGSRAGVRVDPLGVLSSVKVIGGPTDWRPANGAEKAAKRPSEINHGNVITGAGKQSERKSVWEQGVTCDYGEHVAVISFAALRRLGFGGGEKDAAGRAYLAALGLLALAEQDARGYALRSRCDLVCEGRAPLQRVLADGQALTLELDRGAARTLYSQAFDAAKRAGLALREEPVRLVPQDKLVAIVRQSQQLALAGEGGEADETAGD